VLRETQNFSAGTWKYSRDLDMASSFSTRVFAVEAPQPRRFVSKTGDARTDGQIF
jgi:hypothetical protein